MSLVHSANFDSIGSTYNHLVPHTLPDSKSLDFMIRHDAFIVAIDHVFRHLRSRELRVHTLHTDCWLFMRKTTDEARQCSFRRTVRTPAMIRNTLVARRCQEDNFTITCIQWMRQSCSPQMRQRELCLKGVSINTTAVSTSIMSRVQHTIPIAPKTFTANVPSTLATSIFSILSIGVITPAQ
jgi:hypothetical protein